MEQTRKDMIQVLRSLQDIQCKAMEKGIHNFAVSMRVDKLEDEGEGDEGLIREYGDTEDRSIHVYIFRKGDDSDDDYMSETIIQDHSSVDILRIVNQIKSFVGID